MAPEIHKSNTYNIKYADYFALGVILFMMVFGSPPFIESLENDRYYSLIMKDQKTYREFMDSMCKTSKSFKDFIMKMFHPDPENRMSFEEMTSHKWL